MTAFCAQNTFINANADVFVGFVAWAAGSFSSSYVLSLTPTKQNGQFIDSKLMTQCVLAPWLNAQNATVPASSSAAPRPAAPTTARSPIAPSGSAPAQLPVFPTNSTGVRPPPILTTAVSKKPTTTSASIALTGSTSVLSLSGGGGGGGATYSMSLDSRTDIVMPATLAGLTMTTLLMATGTPRRPSATDDGLAAGGGIMTAPGAAPLVPPAGATSFPSPNAPAANPAAATPSSVVPTSGAASWREISGGLLACAVLAVML